MLPIPATTPWSRRHSFMALLLPPMRFSRYSAVNDGGLRAQLADARAVVLLPVRQQPEASEAAGVREPEFHPVVETYHDVGVGLLRAVVRRHHQASCHAHVHDHPASVVQDGGEALPATGQVGERPADQAFRERLRIGTSDHLRVPDRHLCDRVSDYLRSDDPSHSLDLGKLRHGIITSRTSLSSRGRSS